MQTRFKVYGLVSAVIISLILGGCHESRTLDDSPPAVLLPTISVIQIHSKPVDVPEKAIIRQSTKDDSAPAPSKTVTEPVTQWTPLEKLTLATRGTGIVVCEPITLQADVPTADFGAGCGRWLHFTVGGLPQLGQTPLWSSLQRAEKEMGRTDLRLTLPDADQLASILGATHVALGQINGTAAHCTLSYQLYTVPGNQKVSPALTAVGTQTQVLAQLPGIARKLAGQLGVAAPLLPTQIAASPMEIGLLGRLPWYSDASLPSASARQLEAMAARLPLAQLFLANTTAVLTDTQWSSSAKSLLHQAPDNPLVWAQIGYSDPSLLAQFHGQLQREEKKYSQSYLLAAAETWVDRRLHQANAERRAAEQTVKNAPRNPDAWLTLGSTISDEGANLRLGRVANYLSAREWQFLNTVYPQWLGAVSRSAQLDPLYGKAWYRTAQAATFAGNTTLADQAFWKNVALAKTDPGAYSWGLQMYQDKWYPDPAKLHQIASTLAALPYPTIAAGLSTVQMLKDNEQQPNQFQAEWQPLLTSLLARTQLAIAKNPADAQAHYDQAVGLELAGNLSQSRQEYANVAVLKPSDPSAHLDLGDAYDKSGQLAQAVTEYRKALSLAPNSAVVHYDLGWDLKEQSQFPQADAEFRKAIQIAPNYDVAHDGLGRVLAAQNRSAEAAREFQKAAQLNPYQLDAYESLCLLLDEQGDYAGALAAGRHALQIKHDDVNVMDNMSDVYLRRKDWVHSIQMSQAALQASPDDAGAHENLGEAYIGQGKKADAQDEWNKVLALDHGDVAKAAHQMLAKYP